MTRNLSAATNASQAAPPVDFLSYERLLWHTLAKLARRGYFVPPDEGRDLIHDFFVEAWAGLQARYVPNLGSFPAYVAVAFNQFARRRLVELAHWRSKLVDLDFAAEHAADIESPEERVESIQGINLVRKAFESLPGPQRQALADYLDQSTSSERDIARRQGRSRYSVRKSLADGVNNLCVAFDELGFADAEIANLAWRDGRVSADIANRTSLSTQEVQVRRRELATRLLAALRAHRYSSVKGVVQMPFEELITRVLSNANRSAATAELRRHADDIRAALTGHDGAQMLMTEQQKALLAQHPERLAEFYDVVFPEGDDIDDDDGAAAAIARFELDSATQTVRAFEDMAEALPGHFFDWSNWLGQPDGSRRDVEYLLSRPGMDAAGHATRELAGHGLTPATLAEAFGGFAHHFKSRLRHPALVVDVDDHVPLMLSSPRQEMPIGLGALVAQTHGTPGLPQRSGIAAGLTNWALNVLPLLPYAVPGFQVKVREGERPLVLRLAGDELTLGVQWTRRALARERRHVEID